MVLRSHTYSIRRTGDGLFLSERRSLTWPPPTKRWTSGAEMSIWDGSDTKGFSENRTNVMEGRHANYCRGRESSKRLLKLRFQVFFNCSSNFMLTIATNKMLSFVFKPILAHRKRLRTN